MALRTQREREKNWWIQKWNMQRRLLEGYPVILLHGIIFEGKSHFPYLTDSSVLKKANRPLSSIETFALEFAPDTNDDELVAATENVRIDVTPVTTSEMAPSEVPTVSVHAMDVLAEINAKKNPKLARYLLQELASEYDPLRKGYWEYRMETVG
jgi:hypothetical protein